MRDYILLFINGQRFEVRGADAFLTLSDFLRRRLGMCGTKIVCSEGDCGSCTVLVGTPTHNGKLDYRSLDSCIRFMFQLDGVHVISVEGLADGASAHCSSAGTRLNEVQQAMIDCHGSQCGFCTPGFVVAMTGLLENDDPLSVDQWRSGLTGNLCRCTGYSPIITAGLTAQSSKTKKLNELYPAKPMLDGFEAAKADSILVTVETENMQVFCPVDLDAALEHLAIHPNAKVVAGATDVGVQFNKGGCQDRIWIDLNRVRELEGVRVQGDTINAGARVTWAELQVAADKLDSGI